MTIREIRTDDNNAVANIITTVMSSFGAVGDGYSIQDAEVHDMYATYAQPGHKFFVVEMDGVVVGGCGVGTLPGASADVCELKKMYFLPVARGQGFGSQMLRHCLDAARELGDAHCYLETLSHMQDAIRMYEHYGFERLSAPIGNTGHFNCNQWYMKKL